MNSLALSFFVPFVLVFAACENASAKAVLDFDGDGKTDYAVNRASQDQSDIISWYISLSSGGTIIQQFGLTVVHWGQRFDIALVFPFL